MAELPSSGPSTVRRRLARAVSVGLTVAAATSGTVALAPSASAAYLTSVPITHSTSADPGSTWGAGWRQCRWRTNERTKSIKILGTVNKGGGYSTTTWGCYDTETPN